MTNAQHNRKKLSQVCSLEAYQWLQQWIVDLRPNAKYPPRPEHYFYKNTTHRKYLSNFVESVIVMVMRKKGCDPIKAKDAGKSIDKSKTVTDVLGRTKNIGGRVWVRDKDVKPGRADIVVFYKGQLWNLEVKVGHDRQSDAQRVEQQRALRNGERYEVIRSVDDFLGLIEGLYTNTNK